MFRPWITATTGLVLAGFSGACTEVDDDAPLAAPAPQASPGPDRSRYARPSQAEIEARLTPLQYEVTQEDGTERPFHNEFWDSKEEGLYVDVVTGEPLFSSRDKFDSGTGWPSFDRPIAPDVLGSSVDDKLRELRFEVRSRIGDSHLGHVFDDGPLPTGERYCINSAALRFVPKAEMEEQGYGHLLDRVGPPRH